ncbi:MAG: hypothetical protein A2173_10770 [Planctomycetes bacterium RBG_13_44_8b]|nr:MAG: hypothetical protein A2173_10770 [Planctomycetes bacterium RBG_13_44_8b]
MRLEKRIPSGREKNEESIQLLAQLREKLYSEHIGTARRTAFNLSWMQEDGLDTLKEALFGKAARHTKSAAAYGLRKMRGRMEKVALKVLSDGLKHFDRTTAKVCENALIVLRNKTPERLYSKINIQITKIEIKNLPQKKRAAKPWQNTGPQRNYPRRQTPL